MKRLITFLSIILFLVATTFAANQTFASEEESASPTLCATVTKLAKTTTLKLDNSTYKQLTVTWAKVKNATGYEIRYSRYSTMKGAKKVTVEGAKVTSYTLTGLKRNITYYVQVRAYNDTSDKTIYGKYTNPHKKTVKGKLIVIDAGHQSKGNYAKEAIGPGTTTTKYKVSGGATGVSTKQTEYSLNLKVAKLLRKELISRGYDVKMIRTTHDVNISNKERAQMANKWGADAFIRIHADSSTSSSANGASALCPTSSNPYMTSSLISKSTKLSQCVVNGLCSATGAKNRGLQKTDSMTGINWCEVPVTIIEMGFMSNPTEDKKMATTAYQKKLATGIADGIDEYFGR